MTLKYFAGAVIIGTNSDRTSGTWTNLPAGYRFLETDTLKTFYWNGSAWSEIVVSGAAPTGAAAGDLSGTYPSPTVDVNKITFAKIQDIATDKLVGRDAAGSGDPAEIGLGAGLEFDGSNNIRVADNGITNAKMADDSVNTAELVADGVTFAKLQNIATDKLIGRDAAGSGDPAEIGVTGGVEFDTANNIQRSALTGDISANAGSNTTAIVAGVIVDADINASGITTRSKLPTALVYDDETNTYSLVQTFTKSILANGGLNLQKVSKTNSDSPYTASADDSIILIDASGGAFTLNLPAAASNTGKHYKIIRTDIVSSTNILTIDGNSSETIDGCDKWCMFPGEKLEIISDGTNWVVTWHNNPSSSGYFFSKGSTNNRRYGAGCNPTNKSGTTSTTSPAANTLWAIPFIVDKVTKFDTISFEITTAQASQNARAGIYRDNGNMYPGVLIFDTGSISTGTTGVKDTTITSGLQTLQPGLYWLVWETSATTIQIRSIPATVESTYGPFGFSTSWGTGPAYGYSVAHTFGALPDPYTGGATLLSTAIAVGNPVPMIALRPI